MSSCWSWTLLIALSQAFLVALCGQMIVLDLVMGATFWLYFLPLWFFTEDGIQISWQDWGQQCWAPRRWGKLSYIGAGRITRSELQALKLSIMSNIAILAWTFICQRTILPYCTSQCIIGPLHHGRKPNTHANFHLEKKKWRKGMMGGGTKAKFYSFSLTPKQLW